MKEGRSKPRAGLSREIFKSHHELLLQPYSETDANLLAELYGLRDYVRAGDFPRYIKIMGNFYEAEPKVGWQDHARRIVARAREVAP